MDISSEILGEPVRYELCSPVEGKKLDGQYEYVPNAQKVTVAFTLSGASASLKLTITLRRSRLLPLTKHSKTPISPESN
jgi:hypothetical protein